MRYLVTHDLHCWCTGPRKQPTLCDTPDAVGMYLWGRQVSRHAVFQGECPYRFFAGDVELIATILREFPVRRVLAHLPCYVHRAEDHALLCRIGGPPVLTQEELCLVPDY